MSELEQALAEVAVHAKAHAELFERVKKLSNRADYLFEDGTPEQHAEATEELRKAEAEKHVAWKSLESSAKIARAFMVGMGIDHFAFWQLSHG
jgi:hypothetical protein